MKSFTLTGSDSAAAYVDSLAPVSDTLIQKPAPVKKVVPVKKISLSAKNQPEQG